MGERQGDLGWMWRGVADQHAVALAGSRPPKAI